MAMQAEGKPLKAICTAIDAKYGPRGLPTPTPLPPGLGGTGSVSLGPPDAQRPMERALGHLVRAPAATRLKGLTYVPRVIITDKLKSYGAALRKILPSVEHRQHRYLNNRAEKSHQPTRQ